MLQLCWLYSSGRARLGIKPKFPEILPSLSSQSNQKIKPGICSLPENSFQKLHQDLSRDVFPRRFDHISATVESFLLNFRASVQPIKMPDAFGKIIPREHSKWWLYHPDRSKIQTPPTTGQTDPGTGLKYFLSCDEHQIWRCEWLPGRDELSWRCPWHVNSPSTVTILRSLTRYRPGAQLSPDWVRQRGRSQQKYPGQSNQIKVYSVGTSNNSMEWRKPFDCGSERRVIILNHGVYQ